MRREKRVRVDSADKNAASLRMLLPDQTYEQNTTRTKKHRTTATCDTKLTTAIGSSDNDNALVTEAHVNGPTSITATARGTLKTIRKILTDSHRHTETPGAISNANVATAATPPTATTTNNQSNNTVSATLRTLFQLTFSKASPSATLANGVNVAEAAVATPENFRRTSDFFNNIPDYVGEPLRPFTLLSAAGTAAAAAAAPNPRRSTAERRRRRQQRHQQRREPKTNSPAAADVKAEAGGCKDVLKECEEFLHSNRIRPDFFCRYRQATW